VSEKKMTTNNQPIKAAFIAQVDVHIRSGINEFTFQPIMVNGQLRSYTELSPLEQIDTIREIQDKYFTSKQVIQVMVSRKRGSRGAVDVKLIHYNGCWGRCCWLFCYKI
jgi:hypothetical protein